MKRRALLASLAILACASGLPSRLQAQSKNRPYVNCIGITAQDPANEIHYFSVNGSGQYVTTAANGVIVKNITIANKHQGQVNIRIYGKFVPGFDGAFSENYADDFVTLLIPASGTVTITGVSIYGWNNRTAVTNTVYVTGWNEE